MNQDQWIVVRNWDKFQHRDMARSTVPPWIKNYTELLHDDDYLQLTGHARAVLHGLWLEYASTRRRLRLDTLSLSRRLGLRVSMRTLEALNHAGFIEFSASRPASNHASKVASVEVEVEKKRSSALNKTRNEAASANGRAWLCPDCLAPFQTEIERDDHYASCVPVVTT